MNYCECCQYCYKPMYEENYYECQVFGDCEPPDEYATEDGCNCSEELLESILKKNEEAQMKEYEDFVKWYMEQEGNRCR